MMTQDDQLVNELNYFQSSINFFVARLILFLPSVPITNIFWILEPEPNNTYRRGMVLLYPKVSLISIVVGCFMRLE